MEEKSSDYFVQYIEIKEIKSDQQWNLANSNWGDHNDDRTTIFMDHPPEIFKCLG